MKNFTSSPWFLFLAGALIAISIYFFVSVLSPVGGQLRDAEASYRKGEAATSIGERQEAFNKSLATYLKFEKIYKPEYSNGKLYYNIANNYYQLGEYPTAAYYYWKAYRLAPREANVKSNLDTTNRKLGVAPVSDDSVFRKVLFWHYDFSLPERLQAFFVSIVLLLIAASAYVWSPKAWIKTAIFILSLISLVLLVSVFHSRYIANVEGVLIKATPLYRDAGTQYAKVSPEPLTPGSKVDVLDIVQNGTWLKINTPDGTLGYVPYDAARLL